MRLFLGVAVYPLAGFLGYGLDLLTVPLSWMIGAMIAASVMLAANVKARILPGSRQLAQAIVGGSVGLSFTNEALLAAISSLAPMVVAILLGLACSYVAALMLSRMTNLPIITAMLSSLSVGPVESAVLAVRYGVAPTPVIFSQSLRIMLIIMILPPLIVWVGGDFATATIAFKGESWTVMGSLLLLATAIVAALAAVRLRFPNPYFLGPLVAAISCQLFEAPVTAFPFWGLTLAQMLLGIWLGASLDLSFLRSSKPVIGGIVASIVVLLALSVALGVGVAAWMGIPWQVALLATAPGGVAEMALTAKILQQGVALVISFHLTRIFILQLVSPLIVRHLAKREATHV